jgi:hypothetical protein
MPYTGGFLKPIEQRVNAANKLLQDLVSLLGHLNLPSVTQRNEGPNVRGPQCEVVA